MAKPTSGMLTFLVYAMDETLFLCALSKTELRSDKVTREMRVR
jgi:hypothetical protein